MDILALIIKLTFSFNNLITMQVFNLVLISKTPHIQLSFGLLLVKSLKEPLLWYQLLVFMDSPLYNYKLNKKDNIYTVIHFLLINNLKSFYIQILYLRQELGYIYHALLIILLSKAEEHTSISKMITLILKVIQIH